MDGDGNRAWELFRLINPLLHADSSAAVEVYKVEPYVVAADVYAVRPHTGRGGWTWYTGSAGWMYRLITESLLGLRLEVDKLFLQPCLPSSWSQFKIHYRFRGTMYHILVRCDSDRRAVSKITIDGQEQGTLFIPLCDDHREHEVEISIT